MSDPFDRASLEAVGDFLTRFYHEEPDDLEAATEALKETGEQHQYRAEIGDAFVHVLGADLPRGTLNELVRRNANRYSLNDEEAREFLENTYKLNLLSVRADSR